jgi:phage shock protein PspC (stress-responsive transcriptional regulator)
MHKVIAINLNGNAYQLDEDAYDDLRAYLENAEAQLEANPDKVEILRDLEQAIAEKCLRYLAPHKTVVTAAEVDQILRDMGPVEGGAEGRRAEGERAEGRGRGAGRPAAGTPKRLYKIEEGAMVGGVCNGLAAYFNFDPTIIRLAFVLAAVFFLAIDREGAAVFVVFTYIILMFVVPFAHTSEEKAAAQGLPFNAQELIARVRETARSAAHATGKHWREGRWNWRWKPRWPSHRSDQQLMALARPVPEYADYGSQLMTGVLVPLFSIIKAGLFVAMVIGVMMLVQPGGMVEPSPFPMSAGMPIWAAILVLIVVYLLLASAFHLLRQTAYDGYGRARRISLEVWSGFIWVGATLVFFWLAYWNIPAVRDLMHQLPFWPRHHWID